MYENAALHDEDGTWQMIFGVNTLPAYRRRGCAGAVLERVIADARAQEDAAASSPVRTSWSTTTKNSAL